MSRPFAVSFSLRTVGDEMYADRLARIRAVLIDVLAREAGNECVHGFMPADDCRKWNYSTEVPEMLTQLVTGPCRPFYDPILGDCDRLGMVAYMRDCGGHLYLIGEPRGGAGIELTLYRAALPTEHIHEMSLLR